MKDCAALNVVQNINWNDANMLLEIWSASPPVGLDVLARENGAKIQYRPEHNAVLYEFPDTSVIVAYLNQGIYRVVQPKTIHQP